MLRILATTSSLAILTLSFLPAQLAAQSFGFIGATIATGYAENTDDSAMESSFSPIIEGGYVFGIGANSTLVVDGMIRMDYYDNSITGDEDAMLQYQASVHFLNQLNDRVTLGGFAGYGVAPFAVDDVVYQVGFIGASVSFAASDTVSIFGQAGYGTSFDADATDSAGFYNGYFARAGVVYSGLQGILIRAEAEYASTEEYEDSDEPGEMWTVAVLGESQLPFNENMVLTYGVRYGFFTALNDSDLVAETTASIGVRYTFGGGTSQQLSDLGYYGSPYLPLRASFWTPEMN